MSQPCRISLKTGFVFENPLDKLPSEFEAWEIVSKSLPQLIKQGNIRNVIENLPSFNTTKLQNYDEIRLAQGQLSALASVYVWAEGDEKVPERLPAIIAKPLCFVSERLGLLPIFNHAVSVLSNCKLKSPELPAKPENMEIILGKFIETYENDWFWLATAGVEIAFARCLPAIAELRSQFSCGPKVFS